MYTTSKCPEVSTPMRKLVLVLSARSFNTYTKSAWPGSFKSTLMIQMNCIKLMIWRTVCLRISFYVKIPEAMVIRHKHIQANVLKGYSMWSSVICWLTSNTRPRGYKTWVQSQTQNKAQWLAACGHVSTSSQSLRFILSLRMNSRFITSRPGLNATHN